MVAESCARLLMYILQINFREVKRLHKMTGVILKSTSLLKFVWIMLELRISENKDASKDESKDESLEELQIQSSSQAIKSNF